MPIPATSPVTIPAATYPFVWVDLLEIRATDPNGEAPAAFRTRPFRVTEDGRSELCPADFAAPAHHRFDLWRAMVQNPARAAIRQQLFQDFLAELMAIKAEDEAVAAASEQAAARVPDLV